ncbi:MAG: tetratricopeptide repeat protein [Candidatus Neomarinimicrobiota bacterium]
MFTYFKFAVVMLTAAILLIFSGCTDRDSTKIPITTNSDAALQNYLTGRDLSEKLRGQESIQYFQKAVEIDPNFALAYLNLAQVVPSAKEFFDNLEIAKGLTGHISEGEKLMISGLDAAVNGFLMKQRAIYTELTKMFPLDERAHNLLGNHYFGQQEYLLSIEEYNKAIAINPAFSQCYNQLGYAHRFLGQYELAETDFRKYIELIPDDPNPLDSYAELLLKMGQYEASIEQYQKALKIDPNFVASHIGIATNLNLLNRHTQARSQLVLLNGIARNDGERRASHFATAVSYIDEGNYAAALQEIRTMSGLAQKINDATNLAGDQVLMGLINLEMGDSKSAAKHYAQAVEIVEASDLAEDVKNNTRRAYLYNKSRVAVLNQDFELAHQLADKFSAKVAVVNNPFQTKLTHELYGIIALREGKHETAIIELNQANQQNPYNLYRLHQAYKESGNPGQARDFRSQALNFNVLNSLNYSFIRDKFGTTAEPM